jgi:hypothetical protein
MSEVVKYPEFPSVKGTIDNTLVLEKNYQVKNIRVPKGEESNGANVPRIFWCLIPPFKPKYQPAYIVHDYLCNREKCSLADKIFSEVLLEIEDSWATKSMIFAVKLYHKIKYGV